MQNIKLNYPFSFCIDFGVSIHWFFSLWYEIRSIVTVWWKLPESTTHSVCSRERTSRPSHPPAPIHCAFDFCRSWSWYVSAEMRGLKRIRRFGETWLATDWCIVSDRWIHSEWQVRRKDEYVGEQSYGVMNKINTTNTNGRIHTNNFANTLS